MDKEILEEVAEPFLGDDPEVVAVVRDLTTRLVEPGRATDAVLGGIRSCDNRAGRGRRDRRKDRGRFLMHLARLGQPLQVGQPSRLYRGAKDAG